MSSWPQAGKQTSASETQSVIACAPNGARTVVLKLGLGEPGGFAKNNEVNVTWDVQWCLDS